jgi:uncharacterized membrane protein
MWVHCWGWGNRFWGMGPVGWWMPWVFWGLLILLFIYLFTHLRKPPVADGPQDREALELLKKRYVLGEITKEDFENMKREIQ